jgi:hypothetical protein
MPFLPPSPVSGWRCCTLAHRSGARWLGPELAALNAMNPINRLSLPWLPAQ